MVHKRPSIDVTRHWPVNRVHYMSCLEVWIVWRNFPDFFKTEAVVLYTCSIFVQSKSTLQVLSERTASTFREDRLFRQNSHPCHIVVLLAAIFADTECTGDHALYLATLWIFND